MKKLIPWLGAALIITIVFGTVYAASQQSLRLAANDPQISMAEDIASQLDAGASLPNDTTNRVNIADTLDAFSIAYDKSGKPVYGTGLLNGKLPAIPKGVLTSAEGKDYNAVTWQPQSGVRLAAVVVSAKKYYVVSARSLVEVEKRESRVQQIAFDGWVASLVVLFIIYGMPFLYRGQPAAGTTFADPAKHRH